MGPLLPFCFSLSIYKWEQSLSGSITVGLSENAQESHRPLKDMWKLSAHAMHRVPLNMTNFTAPLISYMGRKVLRALMSACRVRRRWNHDCFLRSLLSDVGQVLRIQGIDTPRLNYQIKITWGLVGNAIPLQIQASSNFMTWHHSRYQSSSVN